MKQCSYRHCRRFIRPSIEYCGGFRMCQLNQDQLDAMSEGMRQAIIEFVEKRCQDD